MELKTKIHFYFEEFYVRQEYDVYDRRCDGPYSGWDDSTGNWALVNTFHECCESPDCDVKVKVQIYKLENGDEKGECKREYWEAD